MKLNQNSLILASLFLGAMSMHGETVTQVGSMSAGKSWLDGIYFSDGLPAHSGADYLVDTAGIRMRTPADGDYTFPGDSLTIANGAEFMFKIPTEASGETPIDTSFEVANLIFADGILVHGGNTNAGKATITGNLKVVGGMTVNTFQWVRPIQIDSLVSGSGTITIEQSTGNADGRGVVTFTNPGNSFGGSLTILETGTVDFDYDAGTFTHLELAGLLVLDQALVFDSVTIEGTSLDPGTYLAADLQATYPNSINGVEGGSVTVREAITQIGSMSAGKSWLDGAYFSDGLPAHSGANYVLDTAGWRMRTPADGDYSFPGDSLTIANGAEFMFKIPTEGEGETPIDTTFEIADFIFAGGNLAHGGNTNAGKAIITGNLTVVDAMTINTWQWVRPIQIDSLVSGSGTITIEQSTGNGDGRGVVTFTNPDNSFSGDLVVVSTGTVDFDYDATNFANLELDGLLIVDQALTFDTLTVAGTTVAPDTYSVADLAMAFPGSFEGTETGSVTVLTVGDPTWAGLPILNGWVMTENFGYLYVDSIPWVYVADKSMWIYLHPANFSEQGFWNFMLPSAN